VSFPRNSAFSHPAGGRIIPDYPPPAPEVGKTARTDTVEVPQSQLEDWYRRLDALTLQLGNSHHLGADAVSQVTQEAFDLRDEVHAFLRG
jgi:hypothetical protein